MQHKKGLFNQIPVRRSYPIPTAFSITVAGPSRVAVDPRPANWPLPKILPALRRGGDLGTMKINDLTSLALIGGKLCPDRSTATTTITVLLKPYAPALFTTNAGGTGQASTLIAGTTSLAAPTGAFPGSRPAKIGEYISIYATGLGDVSNRPSLGYPSPGSLLATTLATPTVTIGGAPATVSFSGLAPGYVGLYQINVQVPVGAPTGPGIPLIVTIAGVSSNTATIAVDPAP